MVVITTPPPAPPPIVQNCQYQVEMRDIEPRSYKCVTQEEYDAIKAREQQELADTAPYFFGAMMFLLILFLFLVLFK